MNSICVFVSCHHLRVNFDGLFLTNFKAILALQRSPNIKKEGSEKCYLTKLRMRCSVCNEQAYFMK